MNKDHTNKSHRIGHVFFVIGLFTAIFGLTIIAPMNVISTKAFGVSDIIELSNNARLQLNQKELKTNTSLMNASQMKAEDMAKQHYFAHTAPDGTVAWDYFKKVTYSYKIAGENLAITNESAKAVIDGWLNSPAHRDNLLSNSYSDFGIGMAKFGDYQGHKDTYVVVALYGQPAAIQSLTATTAPAGVSASLKPRFLTVSPIKIATIAFILMALGIVIEYRHLKHLHKSKSFA